MKKLEPKQVPQFAALCILSAGTFGYFVVRLVTPSPAAAGTHPPVTTAAAVPATASASEKTVAPTGVVAPTTGTAVDPAGTPLAGTTAAPEDTTVPPPAPAMRDPFVVSYVDPKTAPAQIAPLPSPPALPGPKSGKPGKPSFLMAGLPPAPVGVPTLPGGLTDFRVRPTGVAPLPTVRKAPAPPPAPAWTVTGVLQGDAEQVAILRDGEARRIVRTGDAVDGLYKVVDVTRSTVTLRHGKFFYRLTLGAVKAAPVPVSPATLLKPMAPAVPSFAAPDPLSYVPARPRHGRRPAVSLAQAGRSLLKMARSVVSPREALLLPPVMEHVRQADRPETHLRFLEDAEPAADTASQAQPDATDPIDKRQAVASSDTANPAD